ncbi:hypothetical protein OIA45_39805 [Streptomyces chartreusis]|uniref:hypothetical protein n=1 Tax=Streptomyces chartreusis TaxID=1969 RepID=UPI00386E635E|nr:hypothetical protein OIA45_39805 [Streptomyces chartreusis]
MSIPQWFAGQALLADDMNARLPRLLLQQNDQTVTNSSTMINSEITFVPEPNALYRYWLWLSYSANQACGFAWAWLAPGAPLASFSHSIADPATIGTANTPQSVQMRRPANTTGRLAGGSDADATIPPANFHSAYDQGTFATDGTLSAVTLQFACASPAGGVPAAQAILRGGNQTRMIYERIG